ncbi:NirA family protein [Poseidonocella sedimentorum]|uniref:Ferredoxin-nitrite reductase n=1 Tax=Poseidonocella sedimentorum TaxID=871652 RepID=A0A1I6DQ65_9RHOB|nr:NirA family protein [Poseidonocella sedimentorum]SFR07574.1 ferredoxin-nitrite reductase [Poseidonocella sedimentorum]
MPSEPQTTGGFSSEQQSYLVDVMARLKLHQAFQSGEAEAAAPETVYGTPLEDLAKEEVKKHEINPSDLWEHLERWTAKNEIATGLDQFLLRHWGFFNVEPNSPGYMMRMRIPACKLRGDQMIALAEICEKYTGGYAHVTTRGNFQMREIEPKNVINIIYALQDAGLSCHGSGADSARNMTTTPTAGFDPAEIIDLAPQTIHLSNLVMRTRELQGIPRKFNISFDNGGTISCVSDTNDISFQAVEIGENEAGLAPGVYCRILLGGITGHKDFARDTGIICRPEDTVQIAAAMLHVFVEHGDRTNRKRARLKYLLDANGFDWFIERTRENLAKFDCAAELVPLSIEHDAPRAPVDRQAHVGIHAQKAPGMNYAGLVLEMGRLSHQQLRAIGEIAMRSGQNDVRLTVWQNVLIPHIADADVGDVVARLDASGLPTSATAFAAGAVACTGKAGCKLAQAFTKEDGTRLVRHLESRFSLDQPINIHLTGCPNSCAQHYIGDIGLMGVTTAEGKPGYNIVLGGGCDLDRGLARPLCGPVDAEEIDQLIENVVANYLARRSDGESFLAFTRRLSDQELPELLAAKSLAA